MTGRAQDMKAIFSEAIAKATSEDLTTYLDEVCGSDGPLRSEIESLVRAHRQAGAFLHGLLENEPPLQVPVSEGPGTTIGRYRLLEKIGEGGMAVVYMAEQTEPIRRRVALKVIKLGMDTQQVIARFEAERQALAMMDHPNIAKVFDAGATETGRPYFVMELVTGVSITEYCDANHLSTKDRLTLFVQVCGAIQHAHQKGIIHRDIKPSNVMVTMHDGKPVPKVIDFGIAKATNQRLTEKTLFTRYAQIIGTPAYMSPEQAELSDVDVDTRSDIYSLGVLLYELLTGTTPFSERQLREAGYAEMQRVIREEEPTKPSTKLSTLGDSLTDIARHRSSSPDLLRRTLRGDLDWIVMKTLEKDRTRRYDGASALLADIQRHLNCEPVSAGPPTALYLVKKLIQRHRRLAGMLTSVALVVLAGLIVSSLMYLRAEQAREREAAARAQAQATVEFLTHDLLESVYPERAKKPEVTVRYLLETASKDLDKRFGKQPLAEATIRETLGLTYQKMGDYNAAVPHLQRTLAIRLVQLGAEDPATLAAMNNLGWLYWYQGRYDEAEPLLVEALEARTRLLGEAHPDTLESMSNLGWLYGMRRIEGQIGKAWELHQKVLEIGIPVLGEEHPTILQSMCDLALEYATVRQLDKAEALAVKGLEISRRTLGNEHEATLYHMSTLAWVYGHQKRYDEALTLAQEAFETSGRVVGTEHLASLWAQSVLGWMYLAQDHYDAAEAPLTESVAISERVFGDTHVLTQFFRSRIIGLYERQERYTELDDLLVKGYEIGRQTPGEEHLHTQLFRHKLLGRLPQLAMLLTDQYNEGRYEDVLTTFNHIEDVRRVLETDFTPQELAMATMAQERLGLSAEAQAMLVRLRQTCAIAEHAYEQQPLYQAEGLLARQDGAVSQAWNLLETGRLDDALEMIQQLPRSSRDHANGSIPSLAKALARAYLVRAETAEVRQQWHEALRAYEAGLLTDPNHVLLLDRLSWLLATCPSEDLRDGSRAAAVAARACELSAWENQESLNTLAAACAETGDFEAAGQWQKAAMDRLPEDARATVRADYAQRLRLYEANQAYHREVTLPMVAWWKLDEAENGTTTDASGNGFEGRLVGDARIVTDPERGNVLHLEGEGYVDCGRDVAFDITGPMTIAAWMKVHVFDTGHQTVVSKGDSTWKLHRNYGASTMRFDCPGLRVFGHGWSALPGVTSMEDARWHHLVGVYDGAEMVLYMDGTVDASTSAAGCIKTNDEPVFIGANSQAPGRKWKGLIDDVRIYNYALTSDEARAIYSETDSG